MELSKGTYGFRFAEDRELSLCKLYATGCDVITDSTYYWDGLERNDGPSFISIHPCRRRHIRK